MPKYAVAYERRHQREVLGRKGALEAQMVATSEIFESEVTPTKEAPQSPISVLSNAIDLELKPLTLPGAWVVVGKKGRPAKVEGKMYDDAVKAKKKKRKRKSKVVDEPQEPADMLAAAADLAAAQRAALEDAPSTSESVDRSARTFARHAKAATRGRSAKAWAGRRLARHEKIAARDALIDALAADGMLEEVGEATSPGASRTSKPEHSAPRKTDRSSHAQKTRRAARFQAAAAHCYSPEEADAEPVAGETPRPTETKPQTIPSARPVTAPLPEAPSTPSVASAEPTPSKAASEVALKKEKKANCSIM